MRHDFDNSSPVFAEKARRSARALAGVRSGDIHSPDTTNMLYRDCAGFLRLAPISEKGPDPRRIVNWRGVRLSVETDPAKLLGLIADLINERYHQSERSSSIWAEDWQGLRLFTNKHGAKVEAVALFLCGLSVGLLW